MDPVSITLTAVGWLMSSLVDKAATALLEAWSKQIGLGEEFETLKDQLLQLGALLKNACGLPTNNSFLEELVQKLQQLVYRAENLLDELDYYRLQDEIHQRGNQEKVNCSNKSSAASSSSGFRRASHSILSHMKRISGRFAPYVLVPLPKTYSPRINLSRRMNELAKKLQEYEEKVRNALQTELLVITARNTEICQTEATNLHQTSSFLTEPIVFGRDQELEKLMNILTNEELAKVGKVPVVAIVGNGGMGKTTLARLVFNDPKVHSYFEVRSWICVSTQFDSVRLTREMLEAACGNRYGELCNLNELQNKLKEKLESKKFLLVLDDMWEYEDKTQWDSVVAPLNYCSVKGSIILVTTRNQSVAAMVDARDNIIHLPGLEENAFLSFFSTCIFNDPNFGGNWRLRKIGQEIANKLKGNPLAAKTVSALLEKNPDERYWMLIRDSEEWKSKSGQNDIMPALRLSYEHMPFHLQRCFSYCAIFPKDHHFTCEGLVYLWMAQGFLDVRFEGKRKEDIGSAYFNDLVNRGFFQTTQSAYGGNVLYTFHDLIHDLAHAVAFKECLTVCGPEPRQIPCAPTIRHLLIICTCKTREVEVQEAIVKALPCLAGENLSSILQFEPCLGEVFLLMKRIQRMFPSSEGENRNMLESILDLLKKAKFLRAVSLHISYMEQLQNFNFQNFVSLRYLKLIMHRVNTCMTLPGEICRLYHLEVFEIEGGMSVELPNNFSDLVSLRHFIVEGKLHSKILGVGKLISLQELNYFHVQQNNGFEIEQLGSLKEIGGSLQISNLENIKSEREANKARLAEKGKLDALYLKWNHGEQENGSVLEGLKPNPNLKLLQIDGYGGVASPTWLDPSLIFLESLTLENCKAWELLPPIGDLEFLKRLKLSGLAVREIGPQCYGTRQSMKFQSLEELKIIDMPDLEKWVWSDQLQQFHCFKKLKELTIRDCPKLVDLPLSGYATSEVLERFPSLERLTISHISRLESFHENLVMPHLRVLRISYIFSLESLDLHSFVALHELIIEECQSLTSLTFGDQLVCLMSLKIRSCKTLSSVKGLKFWVNLEELNFRECPGFIAAWDSASKEIERTEPDFSLSLREIQGDSLALLTLPICKQLTSLEFFCLQVSAFTEEHEVSPQVLTSIDLVDMEGCKKNLQSFPFDLFPCLKELEISFPHIDELPTSSCTEITDECKKLRNIKEVHSGTHPLVFWIEPRREERICQQMDAGN